MLNWLLRLWYRLCASMQRRPVAPKGPPGFRNPIIHQISTPVVTSGLSELFRNRLALASSKRLCDAIIGCLN